MIVGLSTADLTGMVPSPLFLFPLLALTIAASLFPSPVPFALGAAAFFFVWGELSLTPNLAPESGLAGYAGQEPLRIEAVVEGRPEGVYTGGTRLVLRAERLYRGERGFPVAGKVLLFVRTGELRLGDGDRLLFSSRLRRPRPYGLPGEFDYRRYLAYRGVLVTAMVNGAEDLVLIKQGEGWRREVDLLAARLCRLVDRNVPEEEGGILKALLLGLSSGVSPQWVESYARSGVNHILSISGFHVGILFVCLYQTLFFLGRGFEAVALRVNLKRWALLASVPVVLFYLMLSGGAPATLRSVLMIALGAAALTVNREVEPVQVIMLAAFSILAITPQLLFDLGFQLSFLAIWGLVLFAAPAEAALKGMGRCRRWLLLLVVASLSAIAATAVPVAYYFHRVSLIGIVANLVVVPLMGYGAVVVGFSALSVSLLSEPLARPLLLLAAWLVKVSDQAILFLARVPPVTSYRPDEVDLFLAYLLLSALTFIGPARLRALVGGFLLGALLFLGIASAREVNDPGSLRVTYLSIGQGDAALVRFPGGKTMLIDGGGSYHEGDQRVGDRLLAPALWRLGVKRIDYLVATHPHPDHFQGLLTLAASFPVAEFWESGVSPGPVEYRKLRWILTAKGVPIRTLCAGEPPIAIGEAVVEPLWPDPGESPPEDENDTSLVLRVRFGRAALLFTGDLSSAAEEELIARRARLFCSILKVAHHGSRYSSTIPFLKAASPGAAVISAGFENTFRLPAADTLKRFEALNIPVYRTDLQGTIEARCRRDGSFTIGAPWGHFD